MFEGVIDAFMVKKYPCYFMALCRRRLDDLLGTVAFIGMIRAGVDLDGKAH